VARYHHAVELSFLRSLPPPPVAAVQQLQLKMSECPQRSPVGVAEIRRGGPSGRRGFGLLVNAPARRKIEVVLHHMNNRYGLSRISFSLARYSALARRLLRDGRTTGRGSSLT